MGRRHDRTAALSVIAGVLLTLLASSAPAGARVSVERVPLTAPATQVRQLQALGLDVTEQVTRSSATVVARSDAERALLRAAGFTPVTVIADYAARLERDLRAGPARLRAGTTAAVRASALPSGRTGYRTPAELQADLDTLVAANPGVVRKVTLPRRSVDGQPITGVEIASNVNVAGDGRPVYVVMGLHHAREWPSAEIAAEFAADLAAHQADPRIAALLRELRVVVVPVVNPDGYAYSRGTAVGGQPDPAAATKRRNCRALPGDPSGGSCARRRGVDLNRDYGAYWGGAGASTSPDDETYRGTGPWSEPEAAAVHEFTQRLPVTGVQSLHNVAGLILRPPGFQALGLSPDEPRLKALGDAMGAATGYASRYGYELYEVTGATEDWNYVAQGAFGYTIETAGASPSDPSFTGTYATHVVDQYLGGGVSPGPAGKGVREALLLGAEEAMDRRDHTVLRGRAPAGTTLRLHKAFATISSPLCSNTFAIDACGPKGPVLQTPDFLDVTLTVPASGTFSWHVGPSTRPFVRFDPARPARETWTLTCERRGAVTAAKRVFADRGQVVDVDPCDPASLPRTGAATQRAGAVRVSAQAPAQTLAQARRAGRVRLRLQCPSACRATVSLAAGKAVVGRRRATALKAGRRTAITVPLSAAGRRRLASGRAPRTLSATVVVRNSVGNETTVVRRVGLR